ATAGVRAPCVRHPLRLRRPAAPPSHRLDRRPLALIGLRQLGRRTPARTTDRALCAGARGFEEESMEEPMPAELVARARALQPLLREHAAKADADRRVPAECIDALGEAGLFKVSQPKRYGGYATTLRTMLDVSAAVAEGDGSAGWVVALINVCNWLAGLFPERAQEEVFADPQPRVTGVLTPSSTTRKVAGGWQGSGRWYFNSGSLC